MVARMTAEGVLRLFEDPPSGPLIPMTSDGVIHTEDGEVFYEGPFMTIQQLAEYFEVSDSTAHKVVRTMRANGQIRTVGVLDPVQHCRRLWVIPAVRDE